MKNELTPVEHRLLKILIVKPLSVEDVVQAMAPFPEDDVKDILSHLNKKFLIVKHPVMGGCSSCSTCGCQVQYLWRLTFSGRQAAQST